MKKIGIIAIVILCVEVFVALGMGGKDIVARLPFFAPKKSTKAEDTGVSVVVTKVISGKVTEARTFNGNIEPLMDVELMPQIQGRLVSLTLKRDKGDGQVEDVRVAENLEVKEGEILATLDYEGLKADWDRAEADCSKAAQNEDYMKREMDRVGGLLKQGFATDKEHDAAVWQYTQAAEDAKSKRASADQAKWRHEQAFIKAPFDGVVSKVYADPGATVGPGMPVLRLVHLSELRIISYVPNRYIGEDKIAGGKTAVIIRPEGGLKPLTGTVTKVYAESDRATRTNPVEMIIDNMKVKNPATGKEEFMIRGNMYAAVDFSVQTIEKAVKIPADAVVKIDEDDYVFVIKDGVAVRKKVTVGVWEGAFVEIEDGLMADGATSRPLAEGVKKEDLLAEGDTLVVGGQTKLQNGAKVNVVSEVAGGGEEAQPAQE